MVQTKPWSFFIAKKSLVVLILGLSAGAAAPCLFHAGACGLSLCGLLGEVFYSVFHSSACGFLFTSFSRQLAAIGVPFVMFSTGCCLNSSVLCSSSSQLSFSFPVNVCWGPGGVIPFGPLRVLIRLLRLFCSFLSTFVFSSFLCLTFSMTAESHFSVGLGLRAAVFSFA